MGVVRLVPLTRGGACCNQPGGKFPPLGVCCLLLNDGREVERVGEDVGLCARIADETLGVELLCHLHRLLGTDAQLARGQLLQFLTINHHYV